jgi:Cu2+-containing amine oxidase
MITSVWIISAPMSGLEIPSSFYFDNRRMIHRFVFLLLAVLILAQVACVKRLTIYQGKPGPAQILPLDPLTSEEKQTAERVARDDRRVKALLSEHHMLAYVAFIAMKPDDEAKTREIWPRSIQIGRYAEVVFSRENGNDGFQVIVSLKSQEVNHVQPIDRNRVPVPPKKSLRDSARE